MLQTYILQTSIAFINFCVVCHGWITFYHTAPFSVNTSQVPARNIVSFSPYTKILTFKECASQNHFVDKKNNNVKGLPKKLIFNEIQHRQIELAQNLKAAGIHKNFNQILQLLNSAKVRGPPLNLTIYNCAISAYGKCGHWQEGLSLIVEMRQRGVNPDVITYNSAISACAKSKQLDRAMELLLEMKSHNINPDIISYASAIDACAKLDKWKEAEELLARMQKEGLNPNLFCFSALISAYAKGKQWESAISTLDYMRILGLEPNAICYNAAIAACGAAGQWRGALAQLNAMQSQEVEPTVSTYNSVMSACVNAGRGGDAMAIFRQMRERNVRPDSITYTAALSSAKSSIEISNLLRDMVQENIAPNLTHCNCALNQCDWRHAEALLDAMEDIGISPDFTSFSIMTKLYMKGKKWEQALQSIKKMHESKAILLNPGQTIPIKFLEQILEELISNGQYTISFSLLRFIQEESLSPGKKMYDFALAILLSQGNYEKASELMELMSESGNPADKISFVNAVLVSARSGQAKRGIDIVYKFGMACAGACNEAIKVASQAGLWLEVIELAQYAKKQGVYLSDLSNKLALKACGQCQSISIGRGELAKDILYELQERSVELSLGNYASVAAALAREGKVGECLLFFNKMEESGMQPDAATYSFIISALGAAGLWHEGLKMLARMKDRQLTRSTFCYSSAITACGKARQWEKAVLLLYDMEVDGLAADDICYNAAISAAAECGKWQAALSLLDIMRKKGLMPTTITFNAAITACGRGGRADLALSLLDQMRSSKVEVEDLNQNYAATPKPDVISFTAAIDACNQAGSWKEALDVFEVMNSERIEPNWITFSTLLTVLAKGKQWSQLLKMYEVMLDKVPGIKSTPHIVKLGLTACGYTGNAEFALLILENFKSSGRHISESMYKMTIKILKKSEKLDFLSRLEALRTSFDIHSF